MKSSWHFGKKNSHLLSNSQTSKSNFPQLRNDFDYLKRLASAVVLVTMGWGQNFF